MPDRTLEEASSAKEDYTGHERDAETGLHYAGARYYMSAGAVDRRRSAGGRVFGVERVSLRSQQSACSHRSDGDGAERLV
jgi:hypothetical protein